MSPTPNQHRYIFISSLLHDSFRKQVFFSYAGDFYQKKVDRILNPAANHSINMGNCPSRIFSRGHIQYFVFRNSKLLFLFQCLKFAFKVAKTTQKDDTAIFYNISARNMICFYYLKYIKRIKCLVIVTDYNRPEISKKDYFIHQALTKANGILALNGNLKLIPNTRFLNLLLLEDWDSPRGTKNPSIPNSILLSGMLNESTGLPMAIKMMDYLPDHCLYITGILTETDEESFLASLKFKPNIKYLGKLSTDDYLALLKQMECCLSLRNPDDPFNLYNFPSKIGEFLCYNHKVISTISYPSIDKFVIYAPYDAEKLASCILHAPMISYSPKILFEQFGQDAFLEQIRALEAG